MKQVFHTNMAKNSYSSSANCHVQLFYNAIRQGDVVELQKLFDGMRYDDHDQLDIIISEAYEELIWKNVDVTDKICTDIQQKLIELRFWSKKYASKSKDPYIQERREHIVDCVDKILQKPPVCETLFTYMCNFIARSTFVLKCLRKSTYETVPWDEIEFLLVHYLKGQHGSYILSRENLTDYLENFRECLNTVVTENTPKNHGKPLRHHSVKDKVTKDMIDDFTLLQDVHSLETMLYYLKAAKDMDDSWNHPAPVLLRTLHVVGEYLKNTAETSHLSKTMKDLLMSNFPGTLEDSLGHLRDELLKCSFDLPKTIEVSRLKADLGSFKTRVDYLLYQAEVSLIKVVVSRIKNCNDPAERISYYRPVSKSAVSLIHRRIGGVKISELSDLVDKLLEIEELKKISEYDSHHDKIKTTMDKIKMFVEIEKNVENWPDAILKRDDQLQNYVDDILSKMQEFQKEFEPLSENLQTLYDSMKKSDRHRAQVLFSSLNTLCAAFMEIKTDCLEIKTDCMETVEAEMNSKHAENIESFVENLFEEVSKELENERSTLIKTKEAFVKHIPKLVETFTNIRNGQQTTVSECTVKNCLRLVMAPSKFTEIKYDLDSCIGNLEFYLSKYKRFTDSVGTFLLKGKAKDVKNKFLALFEANENLQDRVTSTRVVHSVITDVRTKNLSSTLEGLRELHNQYNFDRIPQENKENIILEKSVYDVLQCCHNAELLQTDSLATACAFDRPSVTLQGKELRNYLAHGNTICDILQAKPSKSLLVNAEMFIKKQEELKRLVPSDQAAQKVIGVGSLPKFWRVYDRMRECIDVQQKLFEAARKNTVKEVEDLMKEGADPIGRCSKQWNVLHYAFTGNSQNVVASLRGKKNFPYRDLMMQENSEEQTPIDLAAASGSTCVLKDCLEHDRFPVSTDKANRKRRIQNLSSNAKRCKNQEARNEMESIITEFVLGLSPKARK